MSPEHFEIYHGFRVNLTVVNESFRCESTETLDIIVFTVQYGMCLARNVMQHFTIIYRIDHQYICSKYIFKYIV